MTAVFADTAFFLALINSRDQYHLAALRLQATLTAPLVTTAWVVVEFANAIAGNRVRKDFAIFLARLRAEADAVIIAPDARLFDQGCELYAARIDQTWSLTDCISFVVMKERSLSDALTADRHFEQAGFRALLLA